ncbi:hypothetical protein [Thalassovita mangrovi]|uniref:hypothetical protein n=1 Tax=Thalassovita mangrovi TaxID=2692236 RepID=UPI0013684938|nr:hypothetical protein [Thalassovita mangrovi]
MKYFPQRPGSADCGPCCVAMLTSCSTLDDALEAFQERNEGGYSTEAQIKAALGALGFEMSNRMGGRSLLNRTFFEERNDNLLIRTKKRSDRNWHWMVWDGNGKRLLDPLRPSRSRFPSNLSVFYIVTKA